MNTFGSWTAISSSLKAWKILRRHSRQVIFQNSSSFFPKFLIVGQTHTEGFLSLQLSRQFWKIQRTDSYLWWLLEKQSHWRKWHYSIWPSTCIEYLPRVWLQEFGRLPRHLIKNWCDSTGRYFWKIRKRMPENLHARSVSLLLSSQLELGVYAHFD